MSYWKEIAEKYSASHDEQSAIDWNGNNSVKQSEDKLNWLTPNGEIYIESSRIEHDRSYKNSNSTDFKITLSGKIDFTFKLYKLDFFERFLVKIWNSKKAKPINGYLLKSSNLEKSEKILTKFNLKEFNIDSISLLLTDGKSVLNLKTTAKFIISRNSQNYVDLLIKLSDALSLHKM